LEGGEGGEGGREGVRGACKVCGSRQGEERVDASPSKKGKEGGREKGPVAPEGGGDGTGRGRKRRRGIGRLEANAGLHVDRQDKEKGRTGGKQPQTVVDLTGVEDEN
jgi:hypothetical protein